MRFLVFFILFISFKSSAFSQCDSTQWAQEGTYQLVKIKENSEAVTISRTPLTSDQLCLIESLRDDYQLIIFQLDAYTRVRIYPRFNPPNFNER